MTDTLSSLVDVRELGLAFEDNGRAKPVLEGISFDLAGRDSLAVIGPSGCGKTSLLLIVAGLISADVGRVLMKGVSITAPRWETALVLQEYGLFPWKTVRQNIELGLKIRKEKKSDINLSSLEEELGIDGLGHLYPQQLSGGQRQRVALARALVLEPELLLLDEPFAALDAMTRERLQQALLDLFARRRLSYMIVTHNIEEAVTLGRRVMVLGQTPTTVVTIMDNPAFGRADQRIDPVFFETCVSLRRCLEGI